MKGKNQFVQGFTGSFENMTIVKAKDGDSIVKGKITTMTNPNTTGQSQRRTVFTDAVLDGKLLKQFLNQNYRVSKATRSPFNEYVSNYCNVDFNPNCFTRRYSSGRAAKVQGDLYPLVVAADIAGAGVAAGVATVDVTWPYNAASTSQNGDDEIRVVAVNIETGDYLEINTGRTREDAAAAIEVPVPASGQYQVTVYAKNTSTGEVSTNLTQFEVQSDEAIVAPFVCP